MAYRTDLGTLRPARKLADGRVVVDAHITRAGIFRYSDSRGRERLELRPKREVFDPASLESFSQVPVTNDHPPEGLVDSKSAKRYMVGTTGEKVIRDDDHVRTTLMVADADTIAEMEAGKLEVSCGYTCDTIEEPGVDPEYGRYDAVQCNIRGNHVAVAVPGARGGKTIRARLDSMTMVLDSELSAKQRHKLSAEDFGVPEREGLPIPDADHVRAAMARFSQYQFTDSAEKRSAFHRVVKRARSLGVDPAGFEKEWSSRLDAAPRRGATMDPEKLQETIRSLSAQLDEARKELQSTKARADSETTRADTNQGRLDQMQKRIEDLEVQVRTGATAAESAAVAREKERADSLQGQVNDFGKTIEARVRDRSKLERQAATVMGADFRMDDLNDRQIREAVVKRLDSSADVSASVPEGVVTGRFLSLVEGHAENARSQARVAAIIVDTESNVRGDSEPKPRKSSMKDLWKQPLPNDIRAKRSGKDA